MLGGAHGFFTGARWATVSGPQRIVIPLPLAIHTANAWLFPGEQPALIDCGIGTPEGLAALHAGLAQNGVPANRLRLLVTHGHIDHAGNAHALHRDHGVRLQASRLESLFIESFRRDAPRRHAAFAKALQEHGCPPAALAAAQRRGERLDAWMEDTPIHEDLHPGQRLTLGSLEATASHAPGHTPGSFVYLTEDNHLVSGDTLLEHITSNAIELLDRDHGRYHQYLQTLDGLRRYVGCRVLPGHHDPFELTDALLDRHMAKHERRSQRVLERLVAPMQAWDLLPEVLPHLAQDEVFLGMCEVVGHLHHLEKQGRVEAVRATDGRRHYVRKPL